MLGRHGLETYASSHPFSLRRHPTPPHPVNPGITAKGGEGQIIEVRKPPPRNEIGDSRGAELSLRGQSVRLPLSPFTSLINAVVTGGLLRA